MSLFNPPPEAKPRNGSLFDPPTEPQRTPPPPYVPPEPPRMRGGGFPPRRVAAIALTAALLGGVGGGGLVLVTGAGDDSAGSTTVTELRSSGGSGASLDANALYAGTAAGVVDITARSSATTSGTDTPFGPFRSPEQSQATATGTGFVIDDDGHIVTAAHVVDDSGTITVRFQDGTTRTARLLGQDDATDVAVLKVDPNGLDLHPLELGSSSDLEVGDAVAAIGDPFGYARSISTGIVSGLDRTIQAPNGFTVAHAIQTDAALNPGNSGGPVLNAKGEVVGIADQIATNGSSNANSGVGFAVPIDLVKSELDQLKAGEKVSHAYLGIATASGTEGNAGALIGSVAQGGPAASAGLRAGDTITALGGTAIKDSNDLIAAIATHKPGERVELTVKRGSDTREVTVTLGTQPVQAASAG